MRTELEIAKATAQAELNHFKQDTDSQLRWLESEIAGIRRDIEKGTLYEANNLVSKAADVVRVYTRYKQATDTLATLKRIEEEAAE